jgi:hypothetical protein
MRWKEAWYIDHELTEVSSHYRPDLYVKAEN